jgi:hypothetical protein
VTFKEDRRELEENICCVDCVEIKAFGLLGTNDGIAVDVKVVILFGVGVAVARGVDRPLLLFLLLLLLLILILFENKFNGLFKVSILGVVGNGTGKDMLKDVGNVM